MKGLFVFCVGGYIIVKDMCDVIPLSVNRTACNRKECFSLVISGIEMKSLSVRGKCFFLYLYLCDYRSKSYLVLILCHRGRTKTFSSVSFINFICWKTCYLFILY